MRTATAAPSVVLSSSFNPPTRAHEEMLRRSLARVPGARPVLLLTLANVDKELFGAGVEERLRMMEALARPFQAEVLTLPGPRFIDVAEELTARGHGQIWFPVGYDTLVRLFDRKYYRDFEAEVGRLFAHSRFIAFGRAPFTLADAQGLVNSLPEAYRSAIAVEELSPEIAAVSSTEARLVAWTDEAERLIPRRVLDVLRELGLYRQDAQSE